MPTARLRFTALSLTACAAALLGLVARADPGPTATADAPAPGTYLVRGARLLEPGALLVMANGGYGAGDGLSLGATTAALAGGASVLFAPAAHLNLGLRIPFARSTITDSTGPRTLAFFTTPALDLVAGTDVAPALSVAGFLEGRLPALGPRVPRLAVGGSASWTGPVTLDVSAGFHAADDAVDASPLYRSATGGYAYDRLELGFAATVPVGDAAFFFEYEGTLVFCGPACASRFELLAPQTTPQRLAAGASYAVGPLVLEAAVDVGLDSAIGAERPAGVPALPPWMLRFGFDWRGSLSGGPARARRMVPSPGPLRAPVPVAPAPRQALSVSRTTPVAQTSARPSLGAPIDPGQCRLRVIVLDGLTGQPIGRAKVGGWTTDERGRLDVDVLPGTVDLAASAAGHAPAVRRLTLPGGTLRSVALYLWPTSGVAGPSGKLSGSIVDGQGNPVAALLTLRPYDGRPALHFPADALFELALPPGKYALEARADGYGVSTTPTQVVQDGSRGVDLMLPAGTTTPAKIDLGEVTLDSSLAFAPGDATLLPSSAAGLDTLAFLLLHDQPHSHLLVSVTVQPSGDEARDLELSQARGRAVTAALQSRGVLAGRLDSAGNGSRPVLTVGDDRYRNARLELFLTQDSP